MNSLFFWLSKLLWLFVSPFNLALLLLVIVWLMLFSNARQIARKLLGCIVIILLFIALFPVGDWLLYPLEKRFQTNPTLPSSVEGIIVLSGALNINQSARWNQTEVNGAADRELAFMKLAKIYPSAKLVYTGGSSRLVNADYKAADVALKLFTEQGFDVSRIAFERQARNTHENATHSYKLLKPGLEGPWILITSAFHMPRSIGVFCKLGWPMIPYQVDHRTISGYSFKIDFNLGGHMNNMDIAIHEWLGLIAYRLTGKTTALLPQQCAQ